MVSHIKGKEQKLRVSGNMVLGKLLGISKCWDGSQDYKLPLHASDVALPT